MNALKQLEEIAIERVSTEQKFGLGLQLDFDERTQRVIAVTVQCIVKQQEI